MKCIRHFSVISQSVSEYDWKTNWPFLGKLLLLNFFTLALKNTFVVFSQVSHETVSILKIIILITSCAREIFLWKNNVNNNNFMKHNNYYMLIVFLLVDIIKWECSG